MSVVSCAGCGAKNRLNEAAAGGLQPRCGKCGMRLEAGAGGGDHHHPLHPLTVTDASFAGVVLKAKGAPVLVDFWAAWCGPCRTVAPVLDQLAQESGGRYRIAKLNVDENPRTAAQFGIQSIPSMLIFKDGQLVDRLVGAQPKQTIAARLAAHR